MPALRTRIDHAPLPFIVSKPELSARHPVLVFLHGYDEGAPAPIDAAMLRHGPLSRAAENGPAPSRSFLIVAPQLPSCGDTWYRYSREVRAIIDLATDAHGGDPARTYLCGFSFGGNGVLDLAPRLGGQVAALWAVDPTRVPLVRPAQPAWISAGQLSRRLQNDFLRRLHPGATPAREDDFVYRDEGHDHVATAAAAFADGQIYDWLLERRAAG